MTEDDSRAGIFAGIRVPKWSQVRIPPGGLRFRLGDDGGVDADPVSLEIRLSAWAHWFVIASSHMKAAAKAAREVEAAHESRSDELLAEAMNQEYRESLQAICACAYLMEAIWYELLDMGLVTGERLAEWEEAKTARHARIMHTFTSLGQYPRALAKGHRENVKILFKLRNMAVHPGVRFRPAVQHPLLEGGVDQGYIDYSARNAAILLSTCFDLIVRLLATSKSRNSEHDRWIMSAKGVLNGAVEESGAQIGDQSGLWASIVEETNSRDRPPEAAGPD